MSGTGSLHPTCLINVEGTSFPNSKIKEKKSGTTAADILKQLNLSGYLLSKGPNEPFFANAESVFDKVQDGEKIFASTKAEVGVLVCA